DWYKITLSSTQTTLHVETSTPADGSGEFVNVFNPHIALYGTSSTTPLFVGTALPDGRNEVINATGLTPGATYRIRVTGEGGTSGTYFLDPPPELDASAPSLPTRLIASSTPAASSAGLLVA